ncbi:MFS transporter [Lactiplantibacillus garii]|uniref:MFS transporter n=1 Tax=Lactiplantibacillus garii TaxID=2306423 RepID=A0A3R8KGX0_9LACO|nr:MFS transporter [Lactiplantibacillus garii]RRK09605.1 MFS transporter [Lactiplantibacillus garii]
MISLKLKTNVFSIAILAFCGILLETSMNVTFPTLSKQFDTTIANTQWITTSYLLAVAVVIILNSYLLRSFPLKTIVSTALLLFLFGDICCYLAPNLPTLIIGRIIQGISTGITLPTMFAIIMINIPQQKQGTYIGIAGMVAALAPSLGPTFGGTMTALFTWREIFLLVFPITLIAGILAIMTTVNLKQRQRSPFNLFQYLLLIIIMVSLTLLLNTLSTGLQPVQLLYVVIIAIVSPILYSQLRRSTNPIINIRIFKQPVFNVTLLIYFLVQFMQMTFTFLLPTLVQNEFRQTTVIAGLILLPGSLLSAVLQPLTGKMLDRLGITCPYKIGAACLLLATGLFVIWHNSIFLLVLWFLLYMTGFSFVFNNSLTVGVQQLNHALITDGNATFNMLQQYSGSLATACISSIIAFIPGLRGYMTSFILIFIVCLLTVWKMRSLKSTL